MAIAALTLSQWEITHGPITAMVPSVLLVQANDGACGDPLDALILRMVRDTGFVPVTLTCFL